MRYFAEGAAHPPRVVSAHVHAVVLVVPGHATAHRVEVKGAVRFLDHHGEVVQVRAAVEVLVFAELGASLSPVSPTGAELDRRPVEQAARRLRGLLHERRGGDEQSRGTARILGDAQPLRVPFDDRADGARIQGVAGRGLLPVARTGMREGGRQPQHPDTQGDD